MLPTPPPSFTGMAAKSRLGLLFVGGIVLTQAGTMTGAVFGWAGVFAVAAILGIIIDVVSYPVVAIKVLFGRAHIGLVSRSLVRELGLIILIAHAGDLAARRFHVVAIAALAIPVVRGGLLFLDTPLERRLRRPVELRNIPLRSIGRQTRVVPTPDLLLSVVLSIPPVVLGSLGVLSGAWWPFLASAVLLVLFLAGWAAWALVSLFASRRIAPRDTYLQQVMAQVQSMRPEAILYFSGPPAAVYQVNMWLRTMEQIGHRVLVVLRERANLEDLAPTTLPVIVIPTSTDLMNFRLPTVRAAFYVAHVGKNIHLQREPRMKHVFIGHGESDKVASINPITKGFDEVWVAGRVSRERWEAARVGVRDDAIVEVGRPQLGVIGGPAPRDGRPLSVLYAPTWEGWTNDRFASSVPTMGVDIVRWLLARPNTRVVYKPHPLIGSVSSAARRANLAIISLVNGSPSAGELDPPGGPQDWEVVPDRDLVVAPDGAPLYGCFNHADVLIGDISSVIPDFLASGKPYVVPNPAGRRHGDLRDELASTRGAYLLDPGRETWEGVLEDAVGPDSMAGARARLREDLLGPRVADPVQPWQDALTRLIDRANAEWPDAVREASARPE